MHLRWSHEGVSLRAPVRNARVIRGSAFAALAVCMLATVGFLSQLEEPAAVPDFERCMWRELRSEAPCDAIRPSFETWNYPSREHYIRARACSLHEADAEPGLVAFARIHAGIGYSHNLYFLRMAANQTGSCPVTDPAWRSQAEREWDVLTGIERDYWVERIDGAQRRAQQANDRAVALRAFLYKSLAAWLPMLIFGWIVALVAFRRALRVAEPIELRVTTSGVQLDGRQVARSNIAFLSIEGQRMRIERWTDVPLYSRPLPPEALAVAGGLKESESVDQGR